MTRPTCRACHQLIGAAFTCIRREGVTAFGQDIEDQGVEPGDRCWDCGVIDGAM
jgi:hypothetical protein